MEKNSSEFLEVFSFFQCFLNFKEKEERVESDKGLSITRFISPSAFERAIFQEVSPSRKHE